MPDADDEIPDEGAEAKPREPPIDIGEVLVGGLRLAKRPRGDAKEDGIANAHEEEDMVFLLSHPRVFLT